MAFIRILSGFLVSPVEHGVEVLDLVDEPRLRISALDMYLYICKLKVTLYVTFGR